MPVRSGVPDGRLDALRHGLGRGVLGLERAQPGRQHRDALDLLRPHRRPAEARPDGNERGGALGLERLQRERRPVMLDHDRGLGSRHRDVRRRDHRRQERRQWSLAEPADRRVRHHGRLHRRPGCRGLRVLGHDLRLHAATRRELLPPARVGELPFAERRLPIGHLVVGLHPGGRGRLLRPVRKRLDNGRCLRQDVLGLPRAAGSARHDHELAGRARLRPGGELVRRPLPGGLERHAHLGRRPQLHVGRLRQRRSQRLGREQRLPG